MSEILRIYQLEGGFCYTSDSLFLYHFAKDALSKLSKNALCLDVGAGGGVLGLLIARDFNLQIDFIEKDKSAFYILKQNIACHKAKEKLRATEGDFLESSFNSRYEFIISNPPFYSNAKQKSQKLAHAKSQDALPLGLMLERCAKLLKPKGKIAFCFDARESEEIFSALFHSKMHLNFLRYVYGNSNKSAKLALCIASRDKKSLEVMPPIFADTKESLQILKRTNTHSIKVKLETTK